MAEPLCIQIASFPKGRREEVRLTLTEFKRSKFLDIRLFADFSTAMGRCATPRGVTVSLDSLPEFARAVADAEAQARALGLIGGAA